MSTREKLRKKAQEYPGIRDLSTDPIDAFAMGAEYILDLLDKALHDRPYIEVADFLNEFDDD
jgi:hypothetical protein